MNLTQKDVDKFVQAFKKEVLDSKKEGSLISLMLEDKETMSAMSTYELELLPEFKKRGLTAPSVSELFGVSMSIKEAE